MDWGRWFRHLVATRGALRRAFPPSSLDAIEEAITRAEIAHAGEIRCAIESALEPGEIVAGKSPRQRAIEVFAGLGVWETDANNGVLIFVLLADHDVEIVADRGFNGRVTAAQWSAVCDRMEAHYRAGGFEAGTLEGVSEVSRLIAAHFPQSVGGRVRDELPNRPTLL
jgi:uncharacterized membrane protein